MGISFGADRIYDVMTELDLFPKSALTTTEFLFVNFGEKEQLRCMQVAKEIREMSVSCEVYPSAKAMKKQLKYANDRGIPFAILIGLDEIEANTITIKNMETGAQTTHDLETFYKTINNDYSSH